MNIIVFENNQKEIELTAEQLNNLDQTFDYLCLHNQDLKDWVEFEFNKNLSEHYPVAFKSGTYRISRPDHVSCTNPSLSDLSIFKIN